MKLRLDTQTGIATVTSSSAGSLTATASITIAYAAIEGGIRVGTGRNEGGGAGPNSLHMAPPDPTRFNVDTSNSSGPPIQKGFTYYASPSDQPAHEGGFVSTTTSGSTVQVGVGVFLHEGLAMDSDDVLVVQYLSGSHQFG